MYYTLRTIPFQNKNEYYNIYYFEGETIQHSNVKMMYRKEISKCVNLLCDDSGEYIPQENIHVLLNVLEKIGFEIVKDLTDLFSKSEDRRFIAVLRKA